MFQFDSASRYAVHDPETGAKIRPWKGPEIDLLRYVFESEHLNFTIYLSVLDDPRRPDEKRTALRLSLQSFNMEMLGINHRDKNANNQLLMYALEGVKLLIPRSIAREYFIWFDPSIDDFARRFNIPVVIDIPALARLMDPSSG